MAATGSERIFSVDKFLGLNESADGQTELKLGEAAKMENFYITDNLNLKTRPAVVAQSLGLEEGEQLLFYHTGILGKTPYELRVYKAPPDTVYVQVWYRDESGQWDGDIQGVSSRGGAPRVSFFESNGLPYVLVGDEDSNGNVSVIGTFTINDGIYVDEPRGVYTPTVITGASPSGGGTTLEPLNILSDEIVLQYSANGTDSCFVLPDMVSDVYRARIDNELADGRYDSEYHVWEFAGGAPPSGINNVVFTCAYVDADIKKARTKFFRMSKNEPYNGTTDNRVFFYGDGTNVCYYTGVPSQLGQENTASDCIYIPAGNEIAVGGGSAITAMTRCGTKLMAFKPDGAYAISYEPTTLADGTVIAGFYLHTVSGDIGNQMDGQVQTVGSYPRTLCNGNLYEWRSANYYNDERYAKCVSQKVARTLSAADPTKIVTCDDNATHTYFLFLNDDCGTVVVNRYDLDAWSLYTGDMFKNVRFAMQVDDQIRFVNDYGLCTLDPSLAYDTTADGTHIPIQAVWESGFMAFGAPHLRKYSGKIWVSILPEDYATLEVAVRTDKRDDYNTKTVPGNTLDFGKIHFGIFSFVMRSVPTIRRLQMKIKKFIYYKLIFRVTTPGAKATVLGYEQHIRYSSQVK